MTIDDGGLRPVGAIGAYAPEGMGNQIPLSSVFVIGNLTSVIRLLSSAHYALFARNPNPATRNL